MTFGPITSPAPISWWWPPTDDPPRHHGRRRQGALVQRHSRGRHTLRAVKERPEWATCSCPADPRPETRDRPRHRGAGERQRRDRSLTGAILRRREPSRSSTSTRRSGRASPSPRSGAGLPLASLASLRWPWLDGLQADEDHRRALALAAQAIGRASQAIWSAYPHHPSLEYRPRGCAVRGSRGRDLLRRRRPRAQCLALYCCAYCYGY